jgi:hypothetical protein
MPQSVRRRPRGQASAVTKTATNSRPDRIIADQRLGVAIVTAALLVNALVPRYEWRQQANALIRIDRWTGSVVAKRLVEWNNTSSGVWSRIWPRYEWRTDGNVRIRRDRWTGREVWEVPWEEIESQPEQPK